MFARNDDRCSAEAVAGEYARDGGAVTQPDDQQILAVGIFYLCFGDARQKYDEREEMRNSLAATGAERLTGMTAACQ